MEMTEYSELSKKLSKNVFLEDAVSIISGQVSNGELNSEQALLRLKKLEKEGFSPFTKEEMEDNWKALTNVIDESEKRLKKTARIQLFIAFTELPLFIIVLLAAIPCGLFELDFAIFMTAVAGVLGAVTTHTFFILRVHQQTATAIDRLAEKRLGILFLRIASNTKQVSVDAEKLINAGTLMFLGHHVKPAEPLGPQDMPGK